MKWIQMLTASIFLLFSVTIYAETQMPWNAWVQQLRQEAVSQGVNPVLFDNIFNGMAPDKRVLHFDRTQPEKRITFDVYRKSRIDAFRIKLGVSEYKRNQQILNAIAEHYGVNPCFI